ncbi:indole-3-glycerol phosphate synthase TrpC [Desulforhopalus singaporensis]|uniref:Indole-3-glycerol phosphate synthase n=1 Tax=Desulforhopalus singaporensis TaxID=91360 RepID=A0A1H0U5F8_9BACT|nr:indole-3-glycerol phosphate synthase TrpC [Desulforhopalus singaporensis]SDP61517.1 indole-3-glycerol phosphate synthase [Desulforhopalus singaporensis]
MAHILDRIVERKKAEVRILKRDGVRIDAAFAETGIDRPRGFRRCLVEYQGVSVIAEVKKASPSKGVICRDFDPVAIAENYVANGAQAISVLTDEEFFQGSMQYLMQVRSAVALPVLRKDFIIDEVQIQEAKTCGTDAILLIAAILDLKQLVDYQALANELGMDVLVEVHDEYETETALQAGSDLIGINNRNLKDFTIDLETTFRLKKMIPPEIPVVSESGLKSAEDFMRLRKEGVCAALVGETLMRAGSKSNVLSSLR